MKRRPTTAEKAHMALVKSFPCCECRDTGQRQTSPTVVHHVRVYGSRRDHKKVVPLCNDHHLELHASHKKWMEREQRWLAEVVTTTE